MKGELEDDTYERQLGRTTGVCTLTVQGIATCSSCVGSDILDKQLECGYLLYVELTVL